MVPMEPSPGARGTIAWCQSARHSDVLAEFLDPVHSPEQVAVRGTVAGRLRVRLVYAISGLIHSEVRMLAALASQIHHLLVRGFLEDGYPPSSERLREATGSEPAEFEEAIRSLEREHGVVLHPSRLDAWVVHPFSASPTATWVQAGPRGWWAPCVWCGLGIAHLVGEPATISCRLGGASDQVVIELRDDACRPTDLVVHFALPPRRAWDNVHFYCATVLPFAEPAEIDRWAARHGLPRGEAIPLPRVSALAKRWYGGHARADWTKWTRQEAAEIFRQVGLTGSFWALDGPEGRF